MAAPIITKSRDACLKKVVDLEKSTAKVSRKSILCPDFQEWPRPSTEIADVILSKLSDKLKSLPNIFKCLKNPSESDQENKRKIRSQLDIGVSAVFRALEKDRLSCVLVSGQAKPAAIVDHVISLARERGCPLLCLDALSTTLSSVTKTKALPLCIGFKTVSTEANSDFTEIVSLICRNTKVTKPPTINSNMSVKGSNLEELPTKLLSESFRPMTVDSKREHEILTELRRILLQSAIKQASEKNSEGKKKKHKKFKLKLKDVFVKSIHCHFEIGKRTVAEILDRGKLQLVLVSNDIVPYLMTEPSSSSLLTIANRVACPVICIPGLTAVLKSVVGGSISVMGFKKFSSLPPGATPVFQTVVEKYLDTIEKAAFSTGGVQDPHKQTLEKDVESSSSTIAIKSQEEIVEARKEDQAKANKGKENEEEEEEEEDYSHLHIMKKDSTHYQESISQMRKEVEEYLRNENLQANFISLDSADKVNSKVTEVGTIQSSLGKRKQSGAFHKCDDEHKSASKKRHIDVMDVGDANLLEGLTSEPKHEQNERNKLDIKNRSDFDHNKAEPENTGFISTLASNQEKETEIDNDSELVSDKNMAEEESQHAKSCTTEVISSSPLFTISRKGGIPSEGNVQLAVAKSAFHKDAASNVLTLQSKKDKILGEEALPSGQKTDAEKEVEHIKKVFEATSVSSHGKKKKRKHESSAGFISLAYTQANIHTMVNDVSKKKKKKKKKN